MDHIELLASAQAALAARGGGNAHTMSTGLTPSDVHLDAALSNLAVAYDNEELIADAVCPIVDVPARSGIYWSHDIATAFNVASVALAGARGRPNEVNRKVGKGTYGVQDYGLMGFVPFDVQALADSPLNPQRMEIETISSFLALARELRVKALLSASGSYGTNTEALVGTARWDDYTNSDPARKVEDVLDGMIVRPNVAIIGAKVARVLRSHPKFQAYVINRSSYAGGATPLRPTRKQIAEAFELDAIYVPKARVNLANEGQAMSLGRIWPDDQVLFLRVEKSPNIQKTNAFAYTFRYAPAGGSSMQVVSWFDQSVGVRGGTYYKQTHSDTELLIAGSNAGYQLTTVVS